MGGHGDPRRDNASRFPAIAAPDLVIREPRIFQVDVVVVLTFKQVALSFPGFADHHGAGDPNVEIATDQFIILRWKQSKLKRDKGFGWDNFPNLCVGPLGIFLRNGIPTAVRLIENTDGGAEYKKTT
ncbi:hypothetical protein EBX31_10230 [bacterium]|nr:hypothetical protein [bacterium]